MKKVISKTVALLAISTAYCICFFSYSFAECKQGNIIILDGTSTSGKTSIAKHLIDLLPTSYVNIALDDFITEIFLEQTKTQLSVLRKRVHQLSEQELRKQVHQRVDAMYDKVRKLVLEGKNVLLDTVFSGLVGENDTRRGSEKLNGLPVAMILAYCPLPVMVERIKWRNVKALLENKPGEVRPMIVSLKFGDIYQEASNDDMVLDVLSRKDIEAAYAISQGVSQEVEEFNQFKLNIISHFGLIDKEYIKIAPRLLYDCIVNTSTLTPQESAQQIFDCINSSDMSAFKINCAKIIKKGPSMSIEPKIEYILETKRLSLRKFVPDDAKTLAPIIETITHEQYAHLSLLEYCQGFIEHKIIPSYEKNGFGLWAIIDKNTGKLIGYCGLHDVKVSGQEKIELAYRIARDFRCKGLATEAAIAVQDYGFNVLKLHEIVSCIIHDNIASIKVAEKVGMKYVHDGELLGKPCKVYQIKKN